MPCFRTCPPDFAALASVLEPRGHQLTGDAARRVSRLFDRDDDWEAEGIEEVESYEANGLATGAVRTSAGLLVIVRHFTHTARQLRTAAGLQPDGGHDELPVENLVGVGEIARTIAVYDGYPDEDSAVQDARRLLLRAVVAAEAQLASSGRHGIGAVLARGADYFLIFRTHPDGTVDVELAEQALDAYAWYTASLETPGRS
ncbi:hypothetical protein [Amycolatopsis sp.]|uniref:hypothetical protein n=1 Tax=Amycolatopsis sp. TaxID=37632 RepID=UPI002CC13326|nr:hypothetical protein [Amycolatopsis sp.]HVV08150.1 hypothetical protein [Amycolatopsis sp.]